MKDEVKGPYGKGVQFFPFSTESRVQTLHGVSDRNGNHEMVIIANTDTCPDIQTAAFIHE